MNRFRLTGLLLAASLFFAYPLRSFADTASDIAAIQSSIKALTGRVDAIDAKIGVVTPVTTVPALPAVQIVSITPNDDSFVVTFKAVPGAADYRICPTPDTWCKYAGTPLADKNGNVSIEANGFGLKGCVVEALDAQGPYADPRNPMLMQPTAMGMAEEQINGHGDPGATPNVIAMSAPFDGQYLPAAVQPVNGFLDQFRDGTFSLVDRPNPGNPFGWGTFYGTPHDYREQESTNWIVRYFGCNMAESRVFQHHDHLMTVASDGGGPGSSYGWHTANASLVLSPKHTLDMSKGSTATVSFEVDSHVDGRRWIRILLTESGDPLIEPGKFDESVLPAGAPHANECTVSGKSLMVEMQPGNWNATYYEHGRKYQITPEEFKDWGGWLKIARATYQNKVIDDNGNLLANGTDQDIDRRHKITITLNQVARTIRVCEADSVGHSLIDQTYLLPAAFSPFGRIQVNLVHQVYHLLNDAAELKGTGNTFWPTRSNLLDQRHWDNYRQTVTN